MGVKNGSLNKLTSNGRNKLPNDIEWETSLNSVFFNPEELLLSAEVAKLLDISVKTVEAHMAIALRRIKTHSEFKNQFPELHSLLTQKK